MADDAVPDFYCFPAFAGVQIAGHSRRHGYIIATVYEYNDQELPGISLGIESFQGLPPLFLA